MKNNPQPQRLLYLTDDDNLDTILSGTIQGNFGVALSRTVLALTNKKCFYLFHNLKDLGIPPSLSLYGNLSIVDYQAVRPILDRCYEELAKYLLQNHTYLHPQQNLAEIQSVINSAISDYLKENTNTLSLLVSALEDDEAQKFFTDCEKNALFNSSCLGLKTISDNFKELDDIMDFQNHDAKSIYDNLLNFMDDYIDHGPWEMLTCLQCICANIRIALNNSDKNKCQNLVNRLKASTGRSAKNIFYYLQQNFVAATSCAINEMVAGEVNHLLLFSSLQEKYFNNLNDQDKQVYLDNVCYTNPVHLMSCCLEVNPGIINKEILNKQLDRITIENAGKSYLNLHDDFLKFIFTSATEKPLDFNFLLKKLLKSKELFQKQEVYNDLNNRITSLVEHEKLSSYFEAHKKSQANLATAGATKLMKI